jgi:hypothetical protein
MKRVGSGRKQPKMHGNKLHPSLCQYSVKAAVLVTGNETCTSFQQTAFNKARSQAKFKNFKYYEGEFKDA